MDIETFHFIVLLYVYCAGTSLSLVINSALRNGPPKLTVNRVYLICGLVFLWPYHAVKIIFIITYSFFKKIKG